ncbi:MAG: carboxypeptidase-like regulatory domain-containing protein, partial [Flavobacteriales bacterium]
MKLIFTLSLALLSLLSIGQEPSIHGTIKDEKNTPMEFVNVILQNVSDSVMVKTAASDQNGYFELIGVPTGNYTLLYKQVGFADLLSQPFDYTEGTNLSVPEVNISSALNELDAVEYVYVKPLVEIKADKTVFNVEGTTNATGLNAMELLRKAPGVMIDNNENIMVKGKGGIVVYIDGKLSPLDGDGLKDMLKNMQSSNIE